MSIQAQKYIEEMNKMYETIIKKEKLSDLEQMFLDLFTKTMPAI